MQAKVLGRGCTEQPAAVLPSLTKAPSDAVDSHCPCRDICVVEDKVCEQLESGQCSVHL
jgi:hypothetical protein